MAPRVNILKVGMGGRKGWEEGEGGWKRGGGGWKGGGGRLERGGGGGGGWKGGGRLEREKAHIKCKKNKKICPK